MGTQFESSNIFSPRTENPNFLQHVPSAYEKIRVVGKGKFCFKKFYI